MNLTADEIRVLKEICEKAMPGPWEICREEAANDAWFVGVTIGVAAPKDARRVCDVHSIMRPPNKGSPEEGNGEFIVAARTALPRALAEIEDARKPCVWTRNTQGTYEPSCLLAFTFDEEDTQFMLFCPNCGHPVEVANEQD